MALAAGSTLGPFRIIELLGKGGMASVYKAYQAKLDRHVALKVLPPEFLHDDSFAKRFEREARVIAKLDHANIVPIYDYGIDDGTPWMAMRMLPVGSLADRLKKGRLDQRRVVAILTQVAEALDHAHANGVIHRDVKPSNVLLDDKDRVSVADFGLARLATASAVLTKTGIMAGTPQYMAPEQAVASDVNRRADVYALGIVAYEMLTGAVPFKADTPIGVLMKHANEPLPIPPPVQVPEPLMQPVLKALAKDPADRWESTGAFSAALGRGLDEVVDGSTVLISNRPPTKDQDSAAGAREPVSQQPWRTEPPTTTIELGKPPVNGTVRVEDREDGAAPTASAHLAHAGQRTSRPKVGWRIAAVSAAAVVVASSVWVIRGGLGGDGAEPPLARPGVAVPTAVPDESQPVAEPVVTGNDVPPPTSPPVDEPPVGANVASSPPEAITPQPPPEPRPTTDSLPSEVPADTVSVPTVPDDTERIAGMLERATVAVADERLEDAVSEYEAVLALESDNAEANQGLSDVRTQIDQRNTVRQNVAVLLEQAGGLVQQRDYDTAIDRYEAALRLDASNAAATSGLSRARTLKTVLHRFEYSDLSASSEEACRHRLRAGGLEKVNRVRRQGLQSGTPTGA